MHVTMTFLKSFAGAGAVLKGYVVRRSCLL